MTLRIQKSAEAELMVFRLIGRIQAEQVPALRELLKSEAQGYNLVLDLEELKLVDRKTVRFLAQIEAEGATLKNCSAFIREWISQEKKRMLRTQVPEGEVWNW